MSSMEPAGVSPREELEHLRVRVLELEQRERERQRTEDALDECMRLEALTRDVSLALIQSATLSHSLQSCAQALVTHLRAAFARIWTLNTETHVLELEASAGMYTHLDGPHSRVPVGSLKIGLIAAERLPHLTNSVIGDPRVSEQEWAKREGMVAFAGYPLLVEGEVVGVIALFARVPLSPAVLDAMASVSNGIALGIERKRVEEERTRLLDIAQKARVQAETALQVRNDFLSSISHDLKTPLATMRGNIQLLQRRLKRGESIDPVLLAERLATLDASIMKMAGMVEDLLDVAKLQTGQKLDLEMRPVRVVTLVQRVCDEQRVLAKRHQIVVHAPIQDVVVLGDQLRLDRVLTNLLTNAIKYSPRGGQITVEVAQAQEQDLSWLVLRIQDQGVGIPAPDLPHIFEPFYRAGNVMGSIQGTGIGLASVSQVIALHGGIITVQSEEGQGSTFIVRLPCYTGETSNGGC